MDSHHAPALGESIYAALFTGLITAGAYIAVPLPFSPVPIVLQNFFVLLAGLLLSPRWALASVGLYLALGAIGLPVFSAARGGLAHFAGPTGGYLVGFLPAALACSLLAARPAPGAPPSGASSSGASASGAAARGGMVRDAGAALAATAIIYALGTPWLARVLDLDAGAALAAGVLPFLPGDLIKVIAAVAVARAARPLMHRLRPGGAGAGRQTGPGGAGS